MFPNLGFRAGHLTMLRFPKGKGMVTRTTTNEPCSTERTFVASAREKKKMGGGAHKEGGCRAQGCKAQEKKLEVVLMALWWSVLG